jgi:uncharacterized protein YcbX
MSIQVTALYSYPVKSCAATPLRVARLGPRGIEHDREFMVVDTRGRFITQREEPRLALVRPGRTETALALAAPGMPELRLEVHDGPRYEVVIWRDSVCAADQGDRVAEWLSSYLGRDCRLVRLPDDVVRPVDPAFATRPQDEVGLADGYPLLLTAEASLAELNSRLEEPLPMNRFRPNVVVGGAGLAYAEDSWAEIRIRNVTFRVVKACARCVITTTDQATAARGREPLATLATYRRVQRGVLFGQNLIHAGPGRIAVGDRVSVSRGASV